MGKTFAIYSPKVLIFLTYREILKRETKSNIQKKFLKARDTDNW